MTTALELSVVSTSVPNMTQFRTAGAVMASLEVNPGQASDLTRIVADPKLRRQLLADSNGGPSDELLAYLRKHVTIDRREIWRRTLSRWSSRGVTPILAGDPKYPKLLGLCWDAPPILFLRGQLHSDTARTVAVVGSRRTSLDALTTTERLAGALVANGVCVVSGLAAGIDTAGHRGALSAGGHTIAVLGTGLDRTYPLENKELADEIASKGGVVSQFPLDGPRTGTTFLMRNHVIAGLSKTSIIMDASSRSGSRHEATVAIGYGRTVLYWEPTLGTQGWARQDVEGGLAKFVSSIEDAVELA